VNCRGSVAAHDDLSDAQSAGIVALVPERDGRALGQQLLHRHLSLTYDVIARDSILVPTDYRDRAILREGDSKALPLGIQVVWHHLGAR